MSIGTLMSQTNNSLYKPKFNSRPYSSQTQETPREENGIGLSLAGEKIKKGYKLPEKYQVSKPQFNKSGVL